MTEVDPNELVSAAEAAKILKQKEPTLATWRCLKTGPRYLKVGRAPFYLRSDLHAWLATRFVETDGRRA